MAYDACIQSMLPQAAGKAKMRFNCTGHCRDLVGYTLDESGSGASWLLNVDRQHIMPYYSNE